jgi:ABC-2 type transport system ATP-binding protein
MNSIETNQLTRSFGARLAVDQLTLSVPSGSVFGFLGPNGAGKTTTVRMLTALIAPSSGTAQVAGYVLGKSDHTLRQHVGLLTETPGLYEQLSAWQNLLFFAQLYDLTQAQAERQARHYLERLSLWERRNDRVSSFSKGMRQKIAIARSLLHEPQIIFLDEPTAGLDPEAARTVRDFIRELRADGRTIFLTTHNLPEADELCDLIGVFKTRLIRLDTPSNLRAALFGQGITIRITGDPAPLIAIIQELPFVQRVSVGDNAISVDLDQPEQHNPQLIKRLVEAGAQIRYVEPRAHTLEEVYLELVARSEEQS